jgi:hypothetical protein
MLGLFLTLAAQGTSTFNADMGQAARDYSAAGQKLPGFLAIGDLEGAEKVFLESVSEEKRTAAHCFQLGESFRLLDPQFARAQHARAFALMPDESQIAQAWATQLHRSGQCEEAEPIYARVSSAGRDWFASVQRTDCLVRTGRLAEALEVWRSLRDSPSLAKAFRVVPDRIAPGDTREHRRLALRKAIASGATEGVEELVLLDLVRPGGQRRFEVERSELEADRRLIQAQLDPASRRARELWAMCDFWVALSERGFPPASAGDFAAQYGERLREFGWLEAGGELPGHRQVLRWATTALLESGLRKPAELLADWERALAARLEEGEADAGRALLEIQRGAGSPEAGETEWLLWTRAQDIEAALALLARRAERLESADPLLRGALERYPHDVRLCVLASSCARREGKGEREALARQIAAGFQPPGSFERVQSAFERLELLLAAREGR